MRILILVQLILGIVAIFGPIFVLILAPTYFVAPMVLSPIFGAFALFCIAVHAWAEGL